MNYGSERQNKAEKLLRKIFKLRKRFKEELDNCCFPHGGDLSFFEILEKIQLLESEFLKKYSNHSSWLQQNKTK